jgi:hypothetical protein
MSKGDSKFREEGSGSRSEPQASARGNASEPQASARGYASDPDTADNAANAPHADYPDDLFCPECGYSLRGISSPRCPECGLLLDFVESDRPLIPWELRREIGRVRAFRQTVWQVLRRPKVFCRAVYRPVDYFAAQKFRWICVFLFWGTLLGLTGIVHATYPNLLPEFAEETGWWFIGVCALSVLLVIAAYTGIPGYFFHPRHLPVPRQNRAVALNYYACAPLALMPLLLPLAAAAAWYFHTTDEHATALLAVKALMLFICGYCWKRWSVFARHTLSSAARRVVVTWLVPLLWALVLPLILLGLPAVAYFLALIYYSLQPVRLGG